MRIRRHLHRALALLVPLERRPGVYGATFLSVHVSDDERRAFVTQLRNAGL